MESQLEEEMAGTIMMTKPELISLVKSVKDIHEAEDLMSRRTVRVYVSAVLFLALKAVMFSLC